VINITDKRARQLYNMEMTRLMQRLESISTKELKPILNRQFMNCAKLVQQGILDGAYHAVDMERDKLVTKVALHYRRTATVFGKKAYEVINSCKGISLPKEVKTPLDEFWGELNRWIPVQTAKKVTHMQTTSKKLLATVIQKGMNEGESHREIASRIRKTGKITTLQRAKTIAVTETHTAAVHSVDVAMKSTRIEMDKEWSASWDERTRPDHAAADGQRVPQDGVFIVGGMPMQYPGDPAGGAEQTVRCRCVLLYHAVKRMDELKPYEPEEGFGDIIPGTPAKSAKEVLDQYAKSGKATFIEGKSAPKLKEGIEKRLGEKLFASKSKEMDDFVYLTCNRTDRKVMILEDYRSATSNLVSQWAATSGDTSRMSIMMQLAAREEFGLQGTTLWWEKEALAGAKELMKIHGTSARKFLRLMYEDTQAHLKKMGLKTVRVARGFRGGNEEILSTVKNPLYKTRVQMQPMSSFSSDLGVAQGFADVDYVGSMFFAEVPIERILSTPVTGFGCMSESEFVVLGAKKGTETVLAATISPDTPDIFEGTFYELFGGRVADVITFREKIAKAIYKVTK
jgi:hypothetical protein